MGGILTRLFTTHASILICDTSSGSYNHTFSGLRNAPLPRIPKRYSPAASVYSFSYTVGAHLPDPMFVIENSAASLSFGEVCYTGQPYETIVRQVRGGVTKVMKNTDPAWGGAFTLFTASP